MLHRLWLVASLIGLLAALSAPSDAAITSVRVASGLDRPIFATAPAGDPDRLFIVEQKGVIKILQNGSILATPFLDIDILVPFISGNSERGLLGLAFHPDYDTNGKFYVNYTNLSGDTVIAEYTVSGDPNVADFSSANILLTIDQPFSNHNGGTVAFSPIDGYLYIGMGDGGSANDPLNSGQLDNTLLGKILRLDVDCATPPCIPPTNPFVGAGDPLDEIWNKGQRNPYRFSFDRANGDMYIGDVGQNFREEVSYQPAASTGGENYGWRIMEGNRCQDNSQSIPCFDPSLTPPIHEYTHGGSPFRCSITGGFVYRGSIAEIQGHYFFADFCSRQIWSFTYDGANVNDFMERTAELTPDVGAIADIAGFGEDGLGELYIIDRDGGSQLGEVFKIVAESTSVDPQGVPALPFALRKAQPNPFQPLIGATSFQVQVEEAGALVVDVYNGAGRKIRELHAGSAAAGLQSFEWDGRDDDGTPQASGVYFVKATMDGRSLTSRVTLVR